MAPVLNLTIDQGTTFSNDLTVNQDDSTPLDLTGYTVRSQVKKSFHSNTVTATFTTTLKDGLGSVTVTNGGVNYVSVPNVIVSGDGSGATATATIDSATGKVVSVTVTNAGTGYTSAPSISFSGGGGSGATATSKREIEIGLINMSLTDVQTTGIVAGRYVYDMEIVSPSGVVSRVIEGLVTFRPEVTV